MSHLPSRLRPGDRVRVVRGASPYTGCRGSISPGPGDGTPVSSTDEPLGYYVAIDGENGRLRPFLVEDLEPLVPARVRPRAKGKAELPGSG